VQLKPRAVYTPALAEADRRKILDLYAQKGYYDASVSPQIIRLPQNRVNVVYQINDGPSTLVSKISFVGNHAFAEDRLSEVINSREERWWRFLSTADEYIPERLAYDKELLRRFYLKNGYTDFEIVDASSELSPDRKAFFVTSRCTKASATMSAKLSSIRSSANLPGDVLRPDLKLQEGDWYDGDAVGRSSDAIENDIRFARLRVRGREAAVDPGPQESHRDTDLRHRRRAARLYRTHRHRRQQPHRDKVIRRQFVLPKATRSVPSGSQDAHPAHRPWLFRRGGHQPEPRFIADKAILTTKVTEKATGELTFGGGYSTTWVRCWTSGWASATWWAPAFRQRQRHPAVKRSSIDFSVTDPYFLDRQPGGRHRRLPDPDRLSGHRAV